MCFCPAVYFPNIDHLFFILDPNLLKLDLVVSLELLSDNVFLIFLAGFSPSSLELLDDIDSWLKNELIEPPPPIKVVDPGPGAALAKSGIGRGIFLLKY